MNDVHDEKENDERAAMERRKGGEAATRPRPEDDRVEDEVEGEKKISMAGKIYQQNKHSRQEESARENMATLREGTPKQHQVTCKLESGNLATRSPGGRIIVRANRKRGVLRVGGGSVARTGRA